MLAAGVSAGGNCSGLRDHASRALSAARSHVAKAVTRADADVLHHEYAPTHDTVHDGGLFGAYHASSPHWPHIRTAVTDFRTTWLSKQGQRASEVSWGAAHFDAVMSGPVELYKARNPTIHFLPYAFQWTVMQPGEAKNTKGDILSNFYPDMMRWYAAHASYQLEDAFLHTAGEPKSPASRLVVHIWDSNRWVINPGDAGVRAYQVDRATRATRGSDGIFFDEHASADVRGRIGKMHVLEYPGFTGYERDVCDMLRTIKRGLAPKIVLLNTAEYTKPFDREMILAAGGALLEKMNNPVHGDMESRWKFIDDLLSHGATIEMVSANSWAEADKLGNGFDAGNYGSRGARLKMWELASYYMVVPEQPDHLWIELEKQFKVPFDQVWLKAQEVNIGHPTGDRRVYREGTDPTGHKYRVWARDFDRALVLVRPRIGWDKQSYGDDTAISVELPTESTWRPVRDDGTLGDPVSSVTLRSPESVILVRGAS